MGKRGPKPKNTISTEWSANLAYAVGLLVTDGCLYNDGRHISFTSKELEQIFNFKKCLSLVCVIGRTISGYDKGPSYRVQFGGIHFYNFLLSIGLIPAKSKTIGAIEIPDFYFFDFLRGCLDGDGSFYSYWDSRWRSSHMFYLEFTSASKEHLMWLQCKLFSLAGIKGHITQSLKSRTYQLKYAKREGLEIIRKMYYSPGVVCLSRKREKILNALMVEYKQQLTYSR
ncbi:MAG TPA: hypothetical protein VGE18_03605 [Candidatus Paceibacterota bacterium]